LPYDLLSDPDHRVLAEWGAWGDYRVFGAKVTGVIRSHWVIDENGIVIDAQIRVSAKESAAKAVQTVC